ncbi:MULTISPECIES: NADH:flavin oxidoreductase/NADH oxidase [unclassified Rhizobium]|jgi:2,4-dienoyl-CoA reductase-like NADH-dependent reductase (Old Yellow Enzyme family)|uniref:NADH:flavin oxidoreductase/NADH oxidase n=1 Tax=unclassified Rhizobium TaxID=2613769 RepID=UPI001029988F|nr:NADH:flavin oxidoreductase/NADH oxidase [Rhizobium sp. BG4]QRM47450.1 NADH:flavin oxidoreductase/NADH oxidase [Rhizobium sp. BG4]
MSKTRLFSPIRIGSLNMRNRIVIAPMCQYSAADGEMTDWHHIHLGHLALSGAGILTIEATAVLPEGRITYGDVGLYSDGCQAAMDRVLTSVRRWSNMPVAIQLGHAGRKASTEKPWLGGHQLSPGEKNGWKTAAPSAVAFKPEYDPPQQLDRDGLKRVRGAFADAARRAAALGIDAVQIHGAHGYLLHQFLSPLSNKRTDEYGGSLENRMRFPLEVFDVVREAFPSDKPVTMRVSATDWAQGGWDNAQTVVFAEALEGRGCSAIHVSTGGLSAHQQISIGPSYQVPFARTVKHAVKIPVIAVGLITDFEQAEAILTTGDADLIAIARAILYDPRWPWHAAAHFGETVDAPEQYLRSQPRQFKDLFGTPAG